MLSSQQIKTMKLNGCLRFYETLVYIESHFKCKRVLYKNVRTLHYKFLIRVGSNLNLNLQKRSSIVTC